MLCFHPSKEGFKGRWGPLWGAWRPSVSIPQRKVSKRFARLGAVCPSTPFPSLKGRFQRGYGRIFRTVEQMFPSLKGRFQRISMLERRAIFGRFPSLKGRFQSSAGVEYALVILTFPSLKGRFQSSRYRYAAGPAWLVSIPQRKVSKCNASLMASFSLVCFHPSKEGFKDAGTDPKTGRMIGFHPSKEGFKAPRRSTSIPNGRGFHPSKEGFKVYPDRGHGHRDHTVSIPQRKVSKAAGLVDVDGRVGRFPSLKGRFQSSPATKAS